MKECGYGWMEEKRGGECRAREGKGGLEVMGEYGQEGTLGGVGRRRSSEEEGLIRYRHSNTADVETEQ